MSIPLSVTWKLWVLMGIQSYLVLILMLMAACDDRAVDG